MSDRHEPIQHPIDESRRERRLVALDDYHELVRRVDAALAAGACTRDEARLRKRELAFQFGRRVQDD